VSFHESNASCLRTTDTKQNAITSAKLMTFGFIAGSNTQQASPADDFTGLLLYAHDFGRYGSNSLKEQGPVHHHNARGPHAPYQPYAAARSISAAM
jgi:hypothetical protein